MSGRSRQTVAIWVGAGIAVLVVVAVLLTTLGSGSSSTSAPPATVPGPTIPLASSEATQLLLELPVPDGDYDAFCDAARELGTDVDPDDPMALLRVVLDSDLDALIAGAPEGLVGPLTRLRDEGPGVTTVLDQVDSIAELTPADTSFASILSRADAALYQAKAAGRNQVVAAEPGYSQAEA